MTTQKSGRSARPHSETESSSRTITPGLLSGGASIGAPVTVATMGAPWWAVLVVSALGLVIAGVQSSLPQDSGDRLAWWKDRRRHRESLARRRRPSSR